ncbi:MAG: hypothetical protein ACUVQH_13535 [Thermogutta sp.]
MNRRRANPNTASETPISLFPFLAVLVCTMGVLILLLVILVRQARLKAVAQARAQSGISAEKDDSQPVPDESTLRQWEEDLAWQEEQLRIAREKTQSQLTEARLTLGHIEDSIRRSREEWKTLQDQLKRVAANRAVTAGSTIKELEQRLSELQQVAHQIKAELDAKKQETPHKTYAIIPYRGKFGTNRRPIYLECRGDGVILQPEGIRFTVEDFLGPLGPGNPLDAALRAIREELLTRKAFDPSGGEPYPLLIVRPDGIEAYYAARAALTSWGAEFGYELVEQDWELTYPERDPGLAEIVLQAVDLARRRQAFLVKAAPGKYGRSPRQFRAAPYTGGAVPSGEDNSPREDPMLAQWLARQEAQRASPHQPSANSSGISPAPRSTGEVASSTHPASPHAAGATAATNNFSPKQTQQMGDPAQSSASAIANPKFEVMHPHQVIGDQVSVTDTSSRPVANMEGLRPLAEKRGRNWGLPAHERSAIPVTRPIRIDCFPDRLVLVPEKGLDGVRVFYLAPSPQKAVEDLVKAISDYVETWGIAGRGMYWRPVLSVHVTEGAETQFQTLWVLLKDSGLEIEQAR